MADQHRLMAEHEDQRLQQQQQQQQQTSVSTSASTSASTSSHSPRLSVVIGGGDPGAGEMQQQCIQSPSVVATRDHEQQTRKKTSFQITSVTVGSRASNDGGEDSADDLDESHTDDLSSELLDISKNTDEVCDIIDQSPVAQSDATSVCDASSVGGGGGPGPGQTNVSVTVVETHTVPMAVAQHPDIQWQNRFKVVKIETGEPFRRGRWLCMNFHDPPASQGDVSEKEGTTGSGSGNSSAASSSHHGELVSGSESGQTTAGFGVASAAAAGMFVGSESGFYSGEAPIYPVSIILQTQQQGGNLDFTNTVVHMQGKTPDYTGTGQQLPADYLHHHHHHHQQQQQQQTLGHHVIPPHTVINPVSDFLQHQQGASLSLGSNVDYAFPPAPPDPSSPPPHPPLAATGSVTVPVSCQADYPTGTSTPNPIAMPTPSVAPLTSLMNVNPAAAPQTEYSQVAAGPAATTTGAVSASSVVMPNVSAAPPVLAAVPAGQSIGTGASGQPPAPAVPVPQLPQQQQQQQHQMTDGGGIGTGVRPANIPLTVNATTAESLVEASVGVLMSPQPIKEQTADGDDAESASGASTVAIDNKIEQAMDLVKSHLMFAVREEVDVLKEKITELMERISQLELENTMLRASASPETLAKLSTPVPTPSSTKTQQQPPTATS